MAHLTRIIGLRYEVAPGPPLSRVRQFTQPRFSPAVGEGPDAPSACIERIARVSNPLRPCSTGIDGHAISMAIGYNRTDSQRVSVESGTELMSIPTAKPPAHRPPAQFSLLPTHP